MRAKEDDRYPARSTAGKYGGNLIEESIERLIAYHWPRNVRELEDVVERSIVPAPEPRVEAEDVRIENGPARPPKLRRTSSHAFAESSSQADRKSSPEMPAW